MSYSDLVSAVNLLVYGMTAILIVMFLISLVVYLFTLISSNIKK